MSASQARPLACPHCQARREDILMHPVCMDLKSGVAALFCMYCRRRMLLIVLWLHPNAQIHEWPDKPTAPLENLPEPWGQNYGTT